MKIIIAGAGDMGFHIAELLTKQRHAITIIDLNSDTLDYAGEKLDINTVKGDSASLSILDEANVASSDLLLAVTTSEKTNLMTAILGKKMGASQTIARVENPEYLTDREKDNFRELGIDTLMSPTMIASHEIYRLIKHEALIDIFDFPDDEISIIGLTVDRGTHILNRTIVDVGTSEENITFRPIVILRGKETIIPRGNTTLRHNDHLFLITRTQKIPALLDFIGKEHKEIKNVMILGGNDICKQAAIEIQGDYKLKLILEDKIQAQEMAQHLRKTLIIHGDPTNLDLLISEDISSMDAVIAMTDSNEANILTSLLARENGVYKTIACVDNVDYTILSQNIGVDTLINKKLMAANRISQFVRKGKIEAITSFHGVDGEIIEYVIQKESRLVRKPIRDLKLPKKSMIAAVIRDNKSHIPHGEFQMQLDDKVIVFAMSEALENIESIFR